MLRANSQYDTPEPVLWVFILLVDGKSKREILCEDEQTVTVTHSSAILKGALSSFSRNLSMKTNCKPCKWKPPSHHASVTD